jgi:hypothetical protein
VPKSSGRLFEVARDMRHMTADVRLPLNADPNHPPPEAVIADLELYSIYDEV